MKVIAIIQAHMSSSRLPGKVLKDIAGKSMLERVIERTARFIPVNHIVVATSTNSVDDAIVALCQKQNIVYFRGSDEDVLLRFTETARFAQADVCIRITSDCPLLDPVLSQHILQSFLNAKPAVEYAANTIPHTYPRGLDTEVFTTKALEQACREATSDYQRRHVTVYMYENPQMFRLLNIASDIDRSDWRWTVDYNEDLEFVRSVYERLGKDGRFSWMDVVQLLEAEPQIRMINASKIQKHITEG